jgi:hypothetical protein
VGGDWFSGKIRESVRLGHREKEERMGGHQTKVKEHC